MADTALRFNDWSGGDWGDRLDGSRARVNQWHGRNMQVYRSGLLGPRWGLRALPITGVPNQPLGGPFGFSVIGPWLYIVDAALHRVDLDGGAAQHFAAYPSPASRWVTLAVDNDGIVYSLTQGGLFSHDPAVLSTVAVPTPEPFRFIRRHNLFLLGVSDTHPWRMWFSTVDDSGPHFDEWDPNGYIDVGDQEPITALLPIYNSLFVGKRSGWWSITGVLGVQNYVRQIAVGNGPVDQRAASVTTRSEIAYWPRNIVPTLFDGASVRLAEEHQVDTYTPIGTQAVAATVTSQRVLYGYDRPAASSALTRDENRWTYHDFSVRLGGWAPDVVSNGYEMPPDVIYVTGQATAAGTPFVAYVWRHEADRPARVDDLDGLPGDASDVPLDAHFSLPEWYEPQGRQVRVRTVIVQFRRWSLAARNTRNRFGVRVVALGGYEEGQRVPDTQWWTEDTNAEPAGTAGTDDSLRINVGDQGYGNGFRIDVLGVIGVAFRELTVLTDIATSRT
jgi:hypothetical protein